MVGGLRAVGGSQQLIFGALVLLAVGNQRFQVGETVVIRADDDDGGLGHVVCNRGKGLDRVGAHLIDDGAGEVRQVDEADGLAVGAGAAFDVLNDDGLADILFCILCQDAGGIVGTGAGLIGNDHGDRAVRGEVGMCHTAECEHHDQHEGKRDDLFHVSSSC